MAEALPAARLIYETHSTSLDNEAGIASGWHDCPLSSSGEQQARELGVRRPEIKSVLCSDLHRSYRTAEIAFEHRQVEIIRDRRLRECDYGDYTRRKAAELDAIRLNHIRDPFLNGESYMQAVARTQEAIREFSAASTGPLLVIGHRVTFYALENQFRDTALAEIIKARWAWQPGWEYLHRDPIVLSDR